MRPLTKVLCFVCISMLLSSCLNGVWTGAGLIYDRHELYHSLSDYKINTIAHRALYQDDLLRCPKCHIDLTVFNGDILLAGHVEDDEMREEAYRRVMEAKNYRRLFKELSTEPIRTNITRDSWITTKICSQLIADSEIDPHTFKVVTSDRIVYLMGDVMPDQADWAVSIARNIADVERVVKLLRYYHLSDKP